MSRVLVAGGVGTLGVAVVRRLLSDPAYDVRVADRKQAPQWMRETCELRMGDLREPGAAAAAVQGCRYVVHLAGPPSGDGLTAMVERLALDSTVLQAAIDYEVERFVYVARAGPPSLGEHLRKAARAEQAMQFVLCRPPVDDIDKAAAAIVAALG